MKVLSFDQLVDKTGKILDRYATWHMYGSCSMIKKYLSILACHGWTELEFNKALLKKIDLEWEKILNPLKFLN
jgi:hypothetical protein